MRVLVTGASGFVGRALCERLVQSGCVVRAAVRKNGNAPLEGIESFPVGDISTTTDWQRALAGIEVVVHAAARVHVMNDVPGSEALYNETNAGGTRNLAAAAVKAGVRRFVFLSSIKVNGEESERVYTADDPPRPRDAYGRSKWLGEQFLREASSAGTMDAVIVRPPLVYGPGVRANFLQLIRWIHKGRPLPLGAIANSRSLVSLWNLTGLLTHVMTHPQAGGRTWLVSDGEDLSTPELIRRIAAAMGRRAHLVPVPPAMLRGVGTLLGRGATMSRLCGSLTVDSQPLRAELGWVPELTVDAALARTIAWFLTQEGSGGGR